MIGESTDPGDDRSGRVGADPPRRVSPPGGGQAPRIKMGKPTMCHPCWHARICDTALHFGCNGVARWISCARCDPAGLFVVLTHRCDAEGLWRCLTGALLF